MTCIVELADGLRDRATATIVKRHSDVRLFTVRLKRESDNSFTVLEMTP